MGCTPGARTAASFGGKQTVYTLDQWDCIVERECRRLHKGTLKILKEYQPAKHSNNTKYFVLLSFCWKVSLTKDAKSASETNLDVFHLWKNIGCRCLETASSTASLTQPFHSLDFGWALWHSKANYSIWVGSFYKFLEFHLRALFSICCTCRHDSSVNSLSRRLSNTLITEDLAILR